MDPEVLAARRAATRRAYNGRPDVKTRKAAYNAERVPCATCGALARRNHLVKGVCCADE